MTNDLLGMETCIAFVTCWANNSGLSFNSLSDARENAPVTTCYRWTGGRGVFPLA